MGKAVSAGRECPCEVTARRAEDGVQDVGRPCRTLILVATGARVGRVDNGGEVGSGNAETVIPSIIDDHVGSGRHVAVDAERTRAARFVQVMIRIVEHADG